MTISIEIIDASLLQVTKNLPMRPITIDGKPYVERYYVGSNPRGEQTWLHRFLNADGDRNFHSHPWYADSMIVCGGYWENSTFIGELHKHNSRRFEAGDVNMINPNTLHKIDRIDAMTWTIIQVKPHWGTWYFINDEGETKEMGKSHDENWWKDYSCRVDKP